MALCEKCGSDNRRDAEFCAFCGKPIVDRATAIATAYCVGAVGIALGGYLGSASMHVLDQVARRPWAPGLILVIQNHGGHYYLTAAEDALYERQSLGGFMCWGLGILGFGLAHQFSGKDRNLHSGETSVFKKKRSQGVWTRKD